MNQYAKHLLILIACIASSQLWAIDNAHFYRATNLFFEPRLERDYLTSFDLFLQSGSTRDARNRDHDTVPLFDIYGTSDMHELAVGVPCKDLSNPLDLIIQQLSLLPSRCVTSNDACKDISKFANYSIGGKFSVMESFISLAQNIKRGFFFHFFFPIRRLKVSDVCFCDISPTDNTCPNINTPIWQAFKNNFDDILARYCLSRECYSLTNIGDVSLDIGWTHSFQKTEVLDFVDTTFKFGIIIPSGEERCEDRIFSIPFGYNGHFGATLSGDLAFGAFDWLTLGAHFDAMVFGNKTKEIRLKTGQAQSGMIKLAKGCSKVERGSQWEVGGYLKLDHFVRGLSFIVGYSFVSKNKDIVTPEDCEKFDLGIANTDQALFGYKMHTVNFFVEYDFSQENKIVGPRIAGYYNWVVGGERIFTTNVGGANFGVEFAWDL